MIRRIFWAAFMAGYSTCLLSLCYAMYAILAG